MTFEKAIIAIRVKYRALNYMQSSGSHVFWVLAFFNSDTDLYLEPLHIEVQPYIEEVSVCNEEVSVYKDKRGKV